MSELKRFNQTINIEIEVDEVAAKLLSFIKPDEKHKEIVVNAIIGHMHNKGNLNALYNALNGFDASINFKVGEQIICADSVNDYRNDGDVRSIRAINQCKVIEINEYAENQIFIQYDYTDSDGDIMKDNRWVNKRFCDKIPVDYEGQDA